MVGTMIKISIKNLSVNYSDGTESLKNVSMDIIENNVNVLFGPSGSGKSTLLRTLNRLNDLADVKNMDGQVIFNNENILDTEINVNELRRKIGIVFSRPITLPLTIYENISYGLEMAGIKRRSVLDEKVEQALKKATLWDEVFDRLHDPANAISGGQQQRLCIARVLALEPDVLLLDEPTSALDPISTSKIEILLQELKNSITILLVPHNIQQAARTTDRAIFLLQGEVVEMAEGKEIFLNPKNAKTQEYIEGRFG